MFTEPPLYQRCLPWLSITTSAIKGRFYMESLKDQGFFIPDAPRWVHEANDSTIYHCQCWVWESEMCSLIRILKPEMLCKHVLEYIKRINMRRNWLGFFLLSLPRNFAQKNFALSLWYLEEKRNNKTAEKEVSSQCCLYAFLMNMELNTKIL